MAKNSKVLKVLTTARGLIAKGWAQNALAEDGKGNIVSVKSDRAANFCAIGALRRAEFKLGTKGVATLARRKLRNVIPASEKTRSVMMFNDYTDKKVVLKLFDRAIERAKG